MRTNEQVAGVRNVRMVPILGLAILGAVGLASCGGSSGSASNTTAPKAAVKRPAWSCTTRSSFKTVGQIVNADPADAPDATKPESFAGKAPKGTHRVTLSESPKKVVYGFVGTDGKLDKQIEVTKTGSTWMLDTETSC